MHDNNQTYMYALFTDGQRMTGTKYGKIWNSREEAREMKRAATSSKGIKGQVVIGRTENSWNYVR